MGEGSRRESSEGGHSRTWGRKKVGVPGWGGGAPSRRDEGSPGRPRRELEEKGVGVSEDGRPLDKGHIGGSIARYMDGGLYRGPDKG